MIGFLVKLLTGGTAAGTFGPWILLGGIVLVGGAGFAAGDHFRGMTDAPIIARKDADIADGKTALAQCQAIHEKARADAAEQALSALADSARNAALQADALARAAAARQKNLNQILQEIANAPPSKICGTSAAELAFRRGVRLEAGPSPTPP